MRVLPLLLIAGAVASCTANAAPSAYETARVAKQEARLASLTAGKVAGPSISCLPSYKANNMTKVDGRAVAFRVGGTVYVNDMQGSCPNMRDPYALVTRQFGSAQLCRGDIVQLTDTQSGMIVGTCTFGDFVPYSRR